jgi:ABC-2 type transport system permease protein
LNLKRIWILLNARNKEFYRDPGSLGWIFVFPIIMVVGFSYLFRIGDNATFKAGVVQTSYDSPSFSQVKLDHLNEAISKLEYHSLDIILTENEYYVNENSPKSKLAEAVYLKETVQPVSNKIRNIVSGKNISYIDWLFPGLLASNVMWMALWGVGWVIVRQRKIGVLKRLKASPVKPMEYLAAQAISRMLVMAVSGVLVYIVGYLIHPFPNAGSYLTLFTVYMVGCFSLSSIGLVAASRISNEELVNGILNLLTYPMMFLSEVWFSLEGSPEWVKSAAHFMPLWHMVKSMRQVMTDGATLGDLSNHLSVLLGIGCICLIVGGSLFRWTKD